MSWYLAPKPLAIIAALQATPPARVAYVKRYAIGTEMDPAANYQSRLVDQLKAEFEPVFNAAYSAVPYDANVCRALVRDDPAEILAALFGDPDGLEWAYPEIAAHRAGIRAALLRRAAA